MKPAMTRSARLTKEDSAAKPTCSLPVGPIRLRPNSTPQPPAELQFIDGLRQVSTRFARRLYGRQS